MNDSNPDPAGTGDFAEGEQPPLPPRRARTWLAVALSVLGVLIVVALVAGFLIHLPYVIISPGFATPLDQKVITVDGAQTYDHRGNVLFLTVRVSTHDPTVWRVVTSWFDPDRDVVKRTDVVGCLSDAENVAINAQLMQQSQDDAKNVALTHLGYTVEASAPQFLAAEVCPGAPAYGKVRAGDSLLAIDDHAVTQLADVASLVRQHQPGQPVNVTYSRGGTTETATVVTGRVANDRHSCVPVRHTTTGTACLGVTMEPDPLVTYRFPIDVKIDTQQVGGPSAGLAFTLAIIDDLTPGNLTGGRRVAVTGTIAPDGAVGPVGGVEQKAITARHNHVSLMIVPKKELTDARQGAGNLKVVGVGTIDEALAALQKAGGAHVPPASPVAARS